MTADTAIPLSGLARRLVQDNILAETAAHTALKDALRHQVPFVSHLVNNKLVSGLQIAEAASDEFGTPLFDIHAINLDLAPRSLVDPKLIRKHRALPLFRRGNRLFIAVSDPTNLRALDEIKFHTGINTEAILVEESALNIKIDRLLEVLEEETGGRFGDLDHIGLEDLDIEAVDEHPNDDSLTSNLDDTPIVRFVNKLLVDAIRGGSSDIHFEPYEKSYRVRFRTDGILHEVTRPPANLAPRLAARLKVMSQMDISERRLPQDGRIKMKLSKTRHIDFRVNTLPTLYGEKVVLRILDPASARVGVEELGFEDDQRKLYLEALQEPQGMILVTGPTGSGKTVTMYTGLNILNNSERNISTAEDPVEINMEGVNQVHVNARVGLTFAEALRAFLRQDPDIIMVGEIRDLETAEIAIKAAQTGHLVLSTLHTNSASETLTRLLNMGVAPFNVATSVHLIIAQRLARKLCVHCSEQADIPRDTLLHLGYAEADLGSLNLRKAVGCDKCLNGYKGRVGIYEVVRVTKELSRIIMEEGNAIQISEQARAHGFPDLRRAGLKKAAMGITTLEEVNRVTKD